MKFCKMCQKEIENHRTYCSNECKHSDSELNAKRTSPIKNEKNKKLKCNICQWETKDILNKGGYPKKHLKEKHSIITDDYMENFSIIDTPLVPTWKCPECNWESKDINNVSGWITTHVKKHYKNAEDFFIKYPELRFSSHQLNMDFLKSTSDIECEICHEKLLFISNSHLRKHGITQKQYKEKFGEIIISEHTKKALVKCGGTKDSSYTSNAENELCDYILKNNIELIQTHRKLGIEIDIFVESKNIGIEYNGLYWHSELSSGKDKKYHLNKLTICENKNIHLIQIFEDEWYDKKEIVLSRLSNILKISNNKKIYAKNCTLKYITNDEKNKFLNINHLQETDKSCIWIGAFYENILISVMTFGMPRISLGSKNIEDGNFELCRFASLLGYNVVGIFSKLLKYFIKHNNPNRIFTYADRRWSNKFNNVYLKNGFKFVSETSPNYFYMKSHRHRIHRYSFTKQRILEMGGDSNYTEWENMQILGYDRIWDCGSLKYEMILNG